MVNPVRPSAEGTTALSMRNFVRSHYKELSECLAFPFLRSCADFFTLVQLFLHRACFTQAMMDYPSDPLSSPYGHSVRAAYTSACVVLEDTRAQYYKKPALSSRIWRIWSFAFTAAVGAQDFGEKATHFCRLSLAPSLYGAHIYHCNQVPLIN